MTNYVGLFLFQYFLYFVFGLGKVEYDIFPVQYLYFCNPAFMTWITLTILVELLYAPWGRTCYQSGITRAWINCFSAFEAGPRRPDEEQVNGVLDGCTQPQHIRLKINISWVRRDTERRGGRKHAPWNQRKRAVSTLQPFHSLLFQYFPYFFSRFNISGFLVSGHHILRRCVLCQFFLVSFSGSKKKKPWPVFIANQIQKRVLLYYNSTC